MYGRDCYTILNSESINVSLSYRYQINLRLAHTYGREDCACKRQVESGRFQRLQHVSHNSLTHSFTDSLNPTACYHRNRWPSEKCQISDHSHHIARKSVQNYRILLVMSKCSLVIVHNIITKQFKA